MSTIHSAFYCFVAIDDVALLAERLRQQSQSLTGSILLASEGINGTIAGAQADVLDFERLLQNDPRFAKMQFKHSACRTQPFGKMKVQCKKEIVAIGVSSVDAISKSGTNLSPQEWRAFIARDDVVLLDNRNSFEYRLGHFRNALDPQVSHYKDFASYLRAELPKWQQANKKIAMYCTGGIRCEKTTAWLQDLGVDAYQLEGGILNYFQSMPDAEQDFVGECFVFDNRISLDTKLNQGNATLEQVYQAEADGAWRIDRAKRLQQAANSTRDAQDDC